MEGKNVVYKTAIIILICILIATNVAQMYRYDSAEKEHDARLDVLFNAYASIRMVKLDDAGNFVNELDCNYIHIRAIEPIGFINYTTITDFTGDTRGFRSILYNVTFDIITEVEVNGSIGIWLSDYTDTACMTFDVAIANNQEPMKDGCGYKFYYISNAYKFLNVIYYEEVVTGKIK